MLQAEKLSVELGGKAVLKDLTVCVDPSEFIAIIGPNGAGKSTLLRTLSGELTSRSGAICLLGKAAHEWQSRELAQRMAVLPQSTQLNFPFLVEDVVAMGRMPHSSGRRKDEQITTEMMQRMDVLHLKKVPYTELSGGEKQRVQLARVMAQVIQDDDNQPRLLLLDEPTAALDIAHQHSLMRFLKELNAFGVAVITVLHDFNLAAQYADKLLSLDNGVIAAFARPEEVITQVHLEQVFGVKALILEHPHTGRPIVTV